MKVTYTPGREVKKFIPLTLNITIETEEELAELYTRFNTILTDAQIANNCPDNFNGGLSEETGDVLFTTVTDLWDIWEAS